MSKGKYYIVEVYEDGTANYFKAVLDRNNYLFFGRTWTRIKDSLETLIDLHRNIQDHKGK